MNTNIKTRIYECEESAHITYIKKRNADLFSLFDNYNNFNYKKYRNFRGDHKNITALINTQTRNYNISEYNGLILSNSMNKSPDHTLMNKKKENIGNKGNKMRKVNLDKSNKDLKIQNIEFKENDLYRDEITPAYKNEKYF